MIPISILTLLLSAAPADGFAFVAMAANAEPVTGILEHLEAVDAELRTSSGTRKVSSLISLRRVGKAVPPFPTCPQILTTTGDRVPGRVDGGDVRGLSFLADLDGSDTLRWKLPFASVAAVWWTSLPVDAPLVADRRDALRTRNGDTLHGTLESFEAEACVFKPQGANETRRVPWRSLSAVAFNPALARSRKPRETFYSLVFANGARLNVTSPIVRNQQLEGRTLFGSDIRVRLADLIALDVRQGRAIDLSDVKPRSHESKGFLGIERTLGLDRTSSGKSLVLPSDIGDTQFDRGLSTMPRSRASYDLAGRYSRFDVVLGLPADVVAGSASVRVLVDGKDMLAENLRMLTPGVSRSLRIPLGAAKELTLVHDFGPSGGVHAEVIWGGARLVE